jgi:hypothetical protein
MKIVELLAIPIGFALVRSITKNIDDEPAAKPILPKDKGFTLGPAAGSMDIKPIIPEGAFKITQEQLAAFDPGRAVTIPTFDPTLPIVKPIKEGKIKKFGTGVNLADLLARQTPRK